MAFGIPSWIKAPAKDPEQSDVRKTLTGAGFLKGTTHTTHTDYFHPTLGRVEHNADGSWKHFLHSQQNKGVGSDSLHHLLHHDLTSGGPTKPLSTAPRMAHFDKNG